VDDYTREISDLKAEIEARQEAEEDKDEIAELQMQLEILTELYRRAKELYGSGERDEAVRRGLKLRGYGDWTLENVYAFVYESAVDLPGQGHQAFVGGIRDQDFAGLLSEPAEN
jgi:hypothetical protein